MKSLLIIIFSLGCIPALFFAACVPTSGRSDGLSDYNIGGQHVRCRFFDVAPCGVNISGCVGGERFYCFNNIMTENKPDGQNSTQ